MMVFTDGIELNEKLKEDIENSLKVSEIYSNTTTILMSINSLRLCKSTLNMIQNGMIKEDNIISVILALDDVITDLEKINKEKQYDAC